MSKGDLFPFDKGVVFTGRDENGAVRLMLADVTGRVADVSEMLDRTIGGAADIAVLTTSS